MYVQSAQVSHMCCICVISPACSGLLRSLLPPPFSAKDSDLLQHLGFNRETDQYHPTDEHHWAGCSTSITSPCLSRCPQAPAQNRLPCPRRSRHPQSFSPPPPSTTPRAAKDGAAIEAAATTRTDTQGVATLEKNKKPKRKKGLHRRRMSGRKARVLLTRFNEPTTSKTIRATIKAFLSFGSNAKQRESKEPLVGRDGSGICPRASRRRTRRTG